MARTWPAMRSPIGYWTIAVAIPVRMRKQSARFAAQLNSPPLTWTEHDEAFRNGTTPGSRRWTSAPSARKSSAASFRMFNAGGMVRSGTLTQARAVQRLHEPLLTFGRGAIRGVAPCVRMKHPRHGGIERTRRDAQLLERED